MPNGTERLDVRVSVRADDGSYILVQYGGRIVSAEQMSQRTRRKTLPGLMAYIFSPIRFLRLTLRNTNG